MHNHMHYIDKTECLEKGIVGFPSIYLYVSTYFTL